MSESILESIKETKELGSQSIILTNGQITKDIWHKIIELENVESIFFDNIDFIGAIPDVIIELKHLKQISFHRCNLKQILFHISKIKGLTRINFKDNDIVEFPENLSELVKLEHVAIANEPIKKIPFFLFQLDNLKSLILTRLNIQVFSNLGKLKQLKKLDLSNNKLTELPLELFKFHNLKTLNFSNNLITTIPKDIYKLRNLLECNFSNNPIIGIQFTYTFTTKKIKNLNILSIFGIEINNNKKKFHCYLKKENVNNYAIFNIIQNQQPYMDFEDFNHNSIYETYLIIYVFGNEKEQKEMLASIRKSIETWVYKQEKDEMIKSVIRYFDYPFENNFAKKTTISYDKLIRYSNAKENLYISSTTGNNFLVDDLLAYIGEEDIEIKEVWNGADKISKIQIKNFKLFQQLNFNVSERINIILGRNGLGKTSILQAITLGLLPLNNDDKSNQLGSYIHFGKKNAAVSIFWGEEYRKAYIFSNELNEEKHAPHPQKLLLSYGVNLNTNPRLDHSDIVKQIVEGNAKRYSTTSIFNDYSTDFYDPIIILQNLHIEHLQSKNKTIAAFVALIKNTINNYLSLIEEKERIYLQQDNLNFFFEDINKNQLKTRHLSEGYRDHILLMTDIIVKIIASRNNIFKEVPTPKKLFAEAKGVIIIDEFDRHLHPVWQRRLLWQLKQDFRNIQFILTTHNLFSLQSAEGFKALLLDVKDGTIQVEEKDIEAGLSMKSIYTMFFDGKNKFFSYEIEEDFKLFYELLRKVKLSTATPKEMKKFKTTIRRLLKKNEEVQIIIARELRQMERQTGKAFEL